jgi:hypothetical protein
MRPPTSSVAARYEGVGYGGATSAAFIAASFVGSATNSASVPAGTYDLDIICGNNATDCLISDVTWQAAY